MKHLAKNNKNQGEFMQSRVVPLVDRVVTRTPLVPSVGLSSAEISHFEELVQAGRIIAILAWADNMANAHADFRPVLGKIDFFCKILNLHGLRELANSLRANSANPSSI